MLKGARTLEPQYEGGRGAMTDEQQLDPQALGDHIDRLYGAARALCGSREEAEDLVRETFAYVLLTPRTLRADDDIGYRLRNRFFSARRTASQRPRTEPFPDISRGDGRRWLWLASRVATLLWDDEAWDVLTARFVQLARDASALSARSAITGVHRFAGEFAMASSLVEEVVAVNEATGASLAPCAALSLVAFQGREAEAAQLIEAAASEVVRRGEGQGLSFIHWVTAVLYNGLGRYEEALAAARQADQGPYASWWRTWGLVELELIEAAARSGKPELAADALGQLSQTTAAGGTDWALGVEARSRALLSEGEAAETLYREAIDALARTRVRAELARAHLLYGEWLRRERRRLDAREQLRTAHKLFTEFGMEAFAQRARVELEATGEHARKRTVETRDDLTPQEAQISRRAADGATNQEIAGQLFISPSTVDYHLRKAFRKLGVKSRHQLKQHVLQPGAQAEPAAREN
jgi:DNA-binding CsgD family transcriptional regulator